MLNPNFAILGALLNLVGCAIYAIDTLKGNTKPNRVSWTLWSIAPTVAFAAEFSQGVRLQSLLALSAGVGPMFVLLASFADRKAYWKLKPFDLLCGALSILALLLWALTGKGNIAIFFSICSDLLACIPTITKAYTNPESENAFPFLTGTLGTFIGLLTLSSLTFASSAFIIYLLIANATIAATILIRQKFARPSEA